jgi:HEPN domain-containing protein
MKNRSLTKDYIKRAGLRLEALQFLFDRGGYADVVREAQEIVELVSKALVRHVGAEPARVHDVSAQLAEIRSRISDQHQAGLDILIATSRELRRDRELAFYGTEDLTPSEFYSRSDAERGLAQAKSSVAFVIEVVGCT